MVKISGANAQDKKEIAAAREANAEDRAAKTAAPKKAAAQKAKRQTTKRADQAPEAKKTAKEQAAAAKKLFEDADRDAQSGLPPGITVEQHENHIRRAALGY